MRFDFYEDEAALVCEPEVAYKANTELNRAWEIIEETDSNLFLTGRAGTGKTTFLKKLRDATSKRLVVLAPTGVAAINASGTTIHSFFQLPFSVYLPGKGFVGADKKYLNMSRQKKRLIMSLSLLVIDEISMVRPDTLDAVDAMLRRLRGNQAPFGGVQLLLIGDLRQLPPVVKEDEWELLKENYASPYFFESHALKRAGFNTIELTTVYRQSDRAFLDILNAIRVGKATQDTLSNLNRRFLPGFNPDDSEGYIRLTTHNRLADDVNFAKLYSLPGEKHTFEAEVKGKFPDSSFPADKLLHLKEGAQVMFVKNDVGSARRYYNGMIGRVESIGEESIKVRPVGEDSIIDVEKAEWEMTRYTLDEATGEILQERTGSFLQYPLQLAWAVTIHKSQGLTFDRAIIDAARSFAPGQTYVALSRCRSLEGLVLSSPLSPAAVITDSGINEFVDDYLRNAPDSEAVERMKRSYAVSLFKDLFDFLPLKRAYEDFYRAAMDYLMPLYPEIEGDLWEMRRCIGKDLAEVSEKFRAGYTDEAAGLQLLVEESPLKERIVKGCDHFLDILRKLDRRLQELPTHVDNSGYAQRLENAFIPLNFHLKLKGLLMRAVRDEGFSVDNYQKAKTSATLMLDREAGSSRPSKRKAKARPAPPKVSPAPVKLTKAPEEAEKPKKAAKEKKPKGYSLFETLKLWQQGMDIPAIARERNLAESTIGSHLGSLISMGKIELGQVVDEASAEKAKAVMSANPEIKFADLREIMEKDYDATKWPPHALSVIWHVMKKN